MKSGSHARKVVDQQWDIQLRWQIFEWADVLQRFKNEFVRAFLIVTLNVIQQHTDLHQTLDQWTNFSFFLQPRGLEHFVRAKELAPVDQLDTTLNFKRKIDILPS